MSGNEDKINATIESLRKNEIQSARKFRILISLSVVLCEYPRRLIGRVELTLCIAYAILTLAPVLVFATYIAIEGVERADPGIWRLFSSMVIMSLVGSALIHVFQALPSIGSAYGCVKRLHGFLHSAEPNRAPMDHPFNLSKADTRPPLALEVKDASFAWSPDRSILHGVNLAIKPGSQIAIIGSTGSGKSLLMKALIGESNSTDATPLVPTAYCGQVPWLENVSAEESWTSHGSNKQDLKRQTEVADCCALQDILSLPDYRTGSVGSGGVRLSGGQRQRLVRFWQESYCPVANIWPGISSCSCCQNAICASR